MDDRQLTKAEWDEVEKIIRQVEEEEALKEIAARIAQQTIKLEQNRVYIKCLETVNAQLRDKIESLSKDLDKLEKELLLKTI